MGDMLTIWYHTVLWLGRLVAGLGIRSFQKNGTIFAFFSVLYKRTEWSLHSFPFFIKKNGTIFAFFSVLYKRTERSFWFHKSYKNCKSRQKKNVKERSFLFIRLKKNVPFFFQFIFIQYIYIYIHSWVQLT